MIENECEYSDIMIVSDLWFSKDKPIYLMAPIKQALLALEKEGLQFEVDWEK